jgi:hypothetical protein
VKLRRKSWFEAYHGFGRRKRCAECGVEPCPDWYMLRDEIWRLIADPKQFLCWPCAEVRLGRPLVPADFADVPVHEEILEQLAGTAP